MEVTPHKIIDNFLSEEEHQDIYKRLMHLSLPVHEMAQTVPMYFSESAGYPDDTAGGGHWHNTLYIDPAPLNEHFEPICYPLLKEVPVKALFRARVNWYYKTPEIIEHAMHTDLDSPIDNLLYYVNTNDGYTKLQCGTKIESIANRAVFFQGHLPHCSSTTTDQLLRCNVNINFIRYEPQ